MQAVRHKAGKNVGRPMRKNMISIYAINGAQLNLNLQADAQGNNATQN